MEKSKIAILVIGLLIVVAAVAALVIDDTKDNTVLTLGKTKYDLEDYKSYGKVWYYENNSTATSDVDTLANYYGYYKTFYKWAEKSGVTLSGDELPAALESGDAEKLMADYELTSGEYMRVKTEIALAEKLMNNGYELGKVPSNVEEIYKNYINSSNYLETSYYLKPKSNETVEDYMKMIDYRVFAIKIPSAPSGEEVVETSGDVSGDISGDAAKAQRILDTKIQAQDVVAAIKDNMANGLSAEDAFTVASEGYENVTRLNLYNQSYMDNGDLDHMSYLYSQRLLNSQTFIYYSYYFGLIDGDYYTDMINAVTNTPKGEFSDIIEANDVVAFVYVEDIRDGLEGEDLDSFRNESATYYVNAYSDRVINKIVFSKYVFNTLPIKVREAEEAAKAEISGDSEEVTLTPDVSETENIVEVPTEETQESSNEEVNG